MIIKHHTNEGVLKKKIQYAGQKFTLANGKDAFFSQNLSGAQDSRYNGLYAKINEMYVKTLESVSTGKEAVEVEKFKDAVVIKRPSLIETYYMPYGIMGLVYDVAGKGSLKIKVDFKEIFNNEMSVEPKIINAGPVKFVKFGFKENVYLAIASNLKLVDCMKKTNVFYELDSQRNSLPENRDVYEIFSAEIKKPARIAFCAGTDLKSIENDVKKLLKIKLEKKPCSPVENALNKLFFRQRIVAGLPWFCKPWIRDELISLKALLILGEVDLFKKIIFDYVKRIPEQGLFSHNGIVMADSIGWVAKRLNDYLDMGFKFSKIEEELIKRKFKDAVYAILKTRAKESFVINKPKETWMDSLLRDGARIEIQALQLNIYKLMSRVAKEPRYKLMEKELKKKVRGAFYKNGVLLDAPGDFTLRPNAFLACYIYPELLAKKEWLQVFKNLLKELWLSWGGLASVSKKSVLYRDVDDGEAAFAYHNGDSWYYLNNIAAICMKNFSGLKKYAQKIRSASMQDLFYQGSVGDCSEISDAKMQISRGAWAQAWSAATLIELNYGSFNF